MPDFEDKTLECKDCHRPFVFKAKDQEFFARMDFTEPKRCKPCRDLKKANQEGGHAQQAPQAQSSEPEDNFRSRGKRPGGGGGRRRREEFYDD